MNFILKRVLRLPAVSDEERYGRALQASQMSDESHSCPTCGFTGGRERVMTVQQDPIVEYLRCPKCRGCSTSWMPTPEYLTEYYSTFYDPNGPKITFPSSAGRFARHIARSTLAGFRESRLRILDFGGGDGTIAKEIAVEFLASHPNSTVEILVADFHSPAPFSQDRLEFSSVRTIEEVPPASFDLVVASAILEHVPNLAGALPFLFRAAAPGGVVYIRVPWVLPLKRWFRSVPLLWPMHIHDLGPSFWNRLPERGVSGRILFSRPPLAETELGQHFILTLISHVMKLPARLEGLLRRRPKDVWWSLVAGWEVIYRMTDPLE